MRKRCLAVTFTQSNEAWYNWFFWTISERIFLILLLPKESNFQPKPLWTCGRQHKAKPIRPQLSQSYVRCQSQTKSICRQLPVDLTSLLSPSGLNQAIRCELLFYLFCSNLLLQRSSRREKFIRAFFLIFSFPVQPFSFKETQTIWLYYIYYIYYNIYDEGYIQFYNFVGNTRIVFSTETTLYYPAWQYTQLDKNGPEFMT